MKDFKLLSITRDFFASVVGLELERAQFFGTRALFGFGFGARVEHEPENTRLSGSDFRSFFTKFGSSSFGLFDLLAYVVRAQL